MRRIRPVWGIAFALALVPAIALGRTIIGPLPANDLQGLVAVTGGQTPALAPLQHNPEPPLKPVPRAKCYAGSHPLAGTQGRVPRWAIDSPDGARGWSCNIARVGHYGVPGGFRTWRYTDKHGHECAFYDTSLEDPLGVVSALLGPSEGVVVLDMSHPAHPVETARLKSLVMLAPHESLNLNARRGLLAADLGNGATLPGFMDLYSVAQDCRHPVKLWSGRPARFGHESGFAPDGKTFYINGGEGIAAVDISDPRHPRTLWEGNEYAHGSSISAGGNRAYVADPINGQLTILGTTQIQARKPSPKVREISRLTWNTVSIPQNALPMRIRGHRYLLEFDEFAFRFTAVSDRDTVGGARVINIDNEKHPRVVSNIRLTVNQPEAHRDADSDPSTLPAPVTNYSAHYCAIPREVNPQIVACSFTNSGLRVFNIAKPRHPREVAYYIAPARSSAGRHVSNFALSQPAFMPKRRQVWYTDGTTGFYSLRLSPKAWRHPVR